MSIEIMNMRVEKPKLPYDVYIDRRSVLGNPFFMSTEAQRDAVCYKYEAWFNRDGYDMEFSKECQRLFAIYQRYGRIRLFCWCAPERCHGETIKKWLEAQ